MAGRDRSIVHPEVWIFHHFDRKPSRFCLVMYGSGQINIHRHVVGVAEQVGEHRIHRKALKMRQAEEMGPHIGLPVR